MGLGGRTVQQSMGGRRLAESLARGAVAAPVLLCARVFCSAPADRAGAALRVLRWSTCPSRRTPSAASARSTPSRRCPSTRRARRRFSHRVSHRPRHSSPTRCVAGVPSVRLMRTSLTLSRVCCLSRRQAAVRPEAVRFRWTDEARFPQEGEDHKEDLAAYGVLQVQAEVPARDQALQALRAWRPEEGARSLRLRVKPATLRERGWLGCLRTIASRSVALYARECGNRCGRLQSEEGECTGRERRSGGDSAACCFESLCRG